MVENWKVEDYYEEIPEFGLEDISGRENWKTVLTGCLPKDETAELFGIPKTLGILICGEDGVGKETLAQAFAGDLGTCGYRLLVLDALDLKAHIFEVFQETKNPLTIIIEGFDQLDEASMSLVCKKIKAAVRQDCPLVILALAEDEDKIPQKIRKYFSVCRLERPDYIERKSFFTTQIEDIFVCKNDFGSSEMAELTDGFLFSELNQLIFLIRSLLCAQVKKQELSQETVISKLENGKILVTKEVFEKAISMAKPVSIKKETEKDVSETKADSLTDILAELLQKVSSGIQVTTGKVSAESEHPKVKEDPAKKYRLPDGTLSEDIDLDTLMGLDD